MESTLSAMNLAYAEVRQRFHSIYASLALPFKLHAAHFALRMDFLLPVALDYGHALRHGTFKEALPLLRLLYIGFCILENQYYVESVGMHLLLFEFQLSHNYPSIQ